MIECIPIHTLIVDHFLVEVADEGEGALLLVTGGVELHSQHGSQCEEPYLCGLL